MNRRADRVKLLYWDRDGVCIWFKRLEAGTFRFPASQEGQTSITISAAESAMLLDGVHLASVRRRKR
ncbi:MAG: IS66 family insertion sequence element accessory protein TnpB [Planctomycetaceae bacterium]|nr:IS66 family insertion sequence element accessory protein TnpB [Planctomycetaceae bacterium]